MATNYCKNCGTNLSPESKFCENCGKTVDAAPTITQESYKTPQTATPSLTPTSRLGAAFWLGLIGAVFGLLIGAIMMAMASYQSDPLVAYSRSIGLIVFSVLGIVGALRIIEGRDTINAGLMILAGVGVLVCLYQIGILSALLFFIGAVLILLKKG
jgi:hypothetical protein